MGPTATSMPGGSPGSTGGGSTVSGNGGRSTDEILFGKDYTPDPEAAKIEVRGGLDYTSRTLGGLRGQGSDVFARQAQAAEQLGQIAAGDRMGAGELAARRAGSQALAQQAALAAGARGYGAGAARQAAMRNQALLATDVAGAASRAAATEQMAARQAQAQILAQQAGQQQAAQQMIDARRLAELQARMQQESNLAGVAGADVGLAPYALQAGGAALGAA